MPNNVYKCHGALHLMEYLLCSYTCNKEVATVKAVIFAG